jgi:hypothetical protein
LPSGDIASLRAGSAIPTMTTLHIHSVKGEMKTDMTLGHMGGINDNIERQVGFMLAGTLA